MPKIGAHVSAAVSLDLSLDRAKEIGAEVTQIFISPPQQWAQTNHPEDEIEQYVKKSRELGLTENFIHGTYLMNLATQDPQHLQKSKDWLIYSLNMAEKLNIKGVIFHPGSHKGNGFEGALDQMVESIKEILEKSPEKPFLILENCAGSGGVIGNFSELGQIIKRVGDKRVKVCLDTQHAFAYGYNLSHGEGLERLIEDFDEEIGLENLAVIHANDSKMECGTLRDRHENIGEGFIGRAGFENIINHPKLSEVPFILEVPGFSGNGPDKENVELLKSLKL